MRVYPAGRNKTDEMAGATALFQRLDQGAERFGGFDTAGRNRVVDPRQVLHHNAACADVEMTNLGIAHLAIGQADIASRGPQERVRTCGPETIEIRGVSLPNGIVGRIFAPAPAIQYGQHHRTTFLHGLTFHC